MRYKQYLIMVIFMILMGCNNSSKKDFDGDTYSIPSADGIELKAEFYKTECNEKPLILLFHQARYSRGEYREIAPRLNALGFCCLAIDQRSGNEVNGVVNESHKQAVEKGLKTEYVDALPDLKATLDYVKEKNFAPNGVILIGSSYSASLIFILASEYAEQVKGLIAFSPGEYFKHKDKQISEYAKNVNAPVFITSSATEKENWEAIYDSLQTEKDYFLPDFEGYHGAKALWDENEGNEKYWEKLKVFLTRY